MQGTSRRVGKLLSLAFLAWAIPFVAPIAFGDEVDRAGSQSPDQLWRETIDLVSRGEFVRATGTVAEIDTNDRITTQVRSWLEEYQEKQQARREMDRGDFEKYVGYAKARIERKEYSKALGWVNVAADCAADREAFLASDWIQQLVNDSLSKADEFRKEQEWRKAWHLYSYLSALYEREVRYQKLEREALTHLRLDTMFKEDSKWEERVEKVRWRDVERALELIDLYYVEPADFRRIAESGLEQILLLSESKSALDEFEGLGDEDALGDFKARVQQHLDQIRSAPSLGRREAVQHFRRVVKKINVQTIRLPEALVVSELVRGALEPLDDFTTVIWPRDVDEFDKHTRGDFVGVGISIIMNRADEIEVVSPLDDTPAYRAGIQAGDVIVSVDGTSLKGISLNKVVGTITGKEGTDVTLTIRRDTEEIEFPLTRARVKIQSVKGVRRDPKNEENWEHWLDRDLGVGYLRVTSFQGNTVEDVENTLSGMVGLRGLVLDLRGNPGGLLDAAWQLSSLFLDRGDTIVSTKGRIKDESRTYDTFGQGSFANVPLIVVVDERSASASEIVSGAIRDNQRGTVVGERTFGKFSVQNLIPLSRSGAKLKITTARYYLPSGESFHKDPGAVSWGVEPDVSVRLVRKERIKLWEMRREADLLGPPKQPKDDKDDKEDDDSDDQASDEEGKDKTVANAEGDSEKKDDADGDKKLAKGDEDEAAEEPEEPKLPQLDQPDENDRPKSDPQLDAALLLMRVTLLGKSYPTHAAAALTEPIESAKP